MTLKNDDVGINTRVMVLLRSHQQHHTFVYQLWMLLHLSQLGN